MIVNTYTNGTYRAEVLDTNHVNVYNGDQLIDWPGPWDTYEGACLWAEAIVEALANPLPEPQPEPQPDTGE